ncbi:MAG: bifunctional diaminohydroxyphosphoribosylaminopyrimidine deaminase/5-amino-6-(5-phosphoribosylamino)uracil reductase RibD [Lewinellaceae bacterium]|nr:bifunctional diaminohydroxyphosphoribosylaminopyrimidine deaminase/5-amino-6-(5-phosphoribosylamino)uracil reductase RibD [Lewinellaceae bacterium]
MQAIQYMQRCFQLARLGAGSVAPNPMVGAVLVHENRIIGEGWHRQFGGPHAEVHALQSVAPADRELIPRATLYCSLEPCFHHGKTPPCVDLILEQKIPKVVVSNVDPNPRVGGQGLDKLRAAGVAVESGVLEAEGRWLNRAFFTWITKKRPWIILKWAQSADGFIARKNERTVISGTLARRLVHRWRAETDAILVGANTALVDNPGLDNRYFFGKSPLRVVLNFKNKIASTALLLDDSQPTWVLGPQQPGSWENTLFQDINPENWIPELLEKLHTDNRAILLVEGGTQVLQQFLDSGYWDEIRVLENPQYLRAGVPAPQGWQHAILVEAFSLRGDLVRVFRK